ncbi:DUF721 domain-containing protein [bacterium]|nr:DUF721 domain-containing protein [bacterium]
MAVEDLGAAPKLARYQLQACWPELVGPTLAQHCTPQRLQGRTLWVLTRAPIWSQELMLQQQSILEKISHRFPKISLEHLRCKVGTLRSQVQPPPPPPAEDLSAIVLPQSVEYRLNKLADEVHDPQLRQSLLRALRQKEKRDQWLRQQGAIACQNCGALQARRTCTGCRQEQRRQRRQQLFQLLGRQPWITYQEAAEQITPLRQGEFHTTRRQLLSILLLNFYQERALLQTGQELPPGLRHLLLQICMISTSTPWDQLQDKHVRYSLGKTWGQAYLDDKAPPPYITKKPWEKNTKELDPPKIP